MDLSNEIQSSKTDLSNLIRQTAGDTSSLAVRTRNLEEELVPVLTAYHLQELMKKSANVHVPTAKLEDTALQMDRLVA